MLGHLILGLGLFLGGGQSPQPSECDYDLKAMMELRITAFDQDPNGGWRALARRPACKGEAAELIRIYRSRQESFLSMLFWHEGQLRASRGEIGEAVALFEKAKRPADDSGWNAYADATIAFLKKDKAALLEARERLLQTPKPPEQQWVDANGKPRAAPKWPMNIDVVNALVACFGKSYDEAYGSTVCRDAGATSRGASSKTAAHRP